MPKLKILQEPNKILREPAKEVPLTEISTEKVQLLIKNMSETLRSTNIGIGLAAPQVGESLRIFLVSAEVKATRDTISGEKKWRHFVFINPKIIKSSKEKKLLAEGCLSVENLFGEVWRHQKLSVEAYDEQGKKFRRSASGLFAQVIQHETDHLNRILFIDKAENLKRLDEKKNVQ